MLNEETEKFLEASWHKMLLIGDLAEGNEPIVNTTVQLMCTFRLALSQLLSDKEQSRLIGKWNDSYAKRKRIA